MLLHACLAHNTASRPGLGKSVSRFVAGLVWARKADCLPCTYLVSGSQSPPSYLCSDHNHRHVHDCIVILLPVNLHGPAKLTTFGPAHTLLRNTVMNSLSATTWHTSKQHCAFLCAPAGVHQPSPYVMTDVPVRHLCSHLSTQA
jgi:hypothetical protein